MALSINLNKWHVCLGSCTKLRLTSHWCDSDLEPQKVPENKPEQPKAAQSSSGQSISAQSVSGTHAYSGTSPKT